MITAIRRRLETDDVGDERIDATIANEHPDRDPFSQGKREDRSVAQDEMRTRRIVSEPKLSKGFVPKAANGAAWLQLTIAALGLLAEGELQHLLVVEGLGALHLNPAKPASGFCQEVRSRVASAPGVVGRIVHALDILALVATDQERQDLAEVAKTSAGEAHALRPEASCQVVLRLLHRRVRVEAELVGKELKRGLVDVDSERSPRRGERVADIRVGVDVEQAYLYPTPQECRHRRGLS